MVRWKGFEPLTFWFVVRHSIQLSYQRISFATVLCGARNILSDSFSIVNVFFEIFWIFLRGLNLGPFALPFPLCFRINGLLISDQESGPGQTCFGSFYGSGRAEKERNVGFHPFFTFLPVPRGRNCRQQANTSLFVQNEKNMYFTWIQILLLCYYNKDKKICSGWENGLGMGKEGLIFKEIQRKFEKERWQI